MVFYSTPPMPAPIPTCLAWYYNTTKMKTVGSLVYSPYSIWHVYKWLFNLNCAPSLQVLYSWFIYSLFHSGASQLDPQGTATPYRHPTTSSSRAVREANIQCKFCGKEFRSSWHRKRHELIHTGQKPFSCHFCHKAFNQRSNLLEHERVHTGSRPHACKYCRMRFMKLRAKNCHEMECNLRAGEIL